MDNLVVAVDNLAEEVDNLAEKVDNHRTDLVAAATEGIVLQEADSRTLEVVPCSSNDKDSSVQVTELASM